MPTILQQLVPMKRFVWKQLKGVDVNRNLSIRVITSAFSMQKVYLQAKQKKKEKTIPKPCICQRVCNFLGISSQMFGRIMQSYLRNKSFYVTGVQAGKRGGNKQQRTTRIPRSNLVQTQVQTWLRKQQQQQQQTTSRQILDYLVQQRLLQVAKDASGKYEQKAMKSALRSVQQWVLAMNYKHEKKTGSIASMFSNC